MTTKAEQFNLTNMKDMPVVNPGDMVRVHQKIKEGGKERLQVFEGIVIAAKHGKGISGTITVRKVVEQIGVERIFPLHSPSLAKIEVTSHGKVRRSKLYYLRTAKGRKSKLKKRDVIFAKAIAPQEVKEVAEAPAAAPGPAPLETNTKEA